MSFSHASEPPMSKFLLLNHDEPQRQLFNSDS